jgi:hypothetical protein
LPTLGNLPKRSTVAACMVIVLSSLRERYNYDAWQATEL